MVPLRYSSVQLPPSAAAPVRSVLAATSAPVSAASPSHQALAVGALRQVAAVQQQVGVGGQRVAPGGQFVGALQQALRVEHGAAQLQAAVAAVRQHVHGADVAAPGQRLADQRQAVGAGGDGDDLDAAPGALLRLQVGDQRRGIGQAGVDEGDLGALHRRLRGRGLGQAGVHRHRATPAQRREVGRVQDARLQRLGQQAPGGCRHGSGAAQGEGRVEGMGRGGSGGSVKA